MICIVHEGNQYVFENTQGEDDKMFYDRCQFLAKNKNVYGTAEELEAMSHLWVQKKYLQVSYEDNMEDMLSVSKSIYSQKPKV